jgi:endoglucanase
MFTGIPAEGEFPREVHTSIHAITGAEVPGGLVDGPVYGTIFRSLAGLSLTEPDEFAGLQNPYVVYHDDMGDYSTNEPTMDGTAGAILMMAHWSDE